MTKSRQGGGKFQIGTLKYWFEKDSGERREVPAKTATRRVLEQARGEYRFLDGSDNPIWWLYKWDPRYPDVEYCLCPGGPGGEEFTWVPRDHFPPGYVSQVPAA